jgi:hypothetical protein
MAPKILNKIMQVNIADQPYCATIQPITGPSRNVPIEPTPMIKNFNEIPHLYLSIISLEKKT